MKYAWMIAGIAALVGCAGSGSHVLGKAPNGAPQIKVASLSSSDGPVTLHGTMIEKCPVAGCWFKLRDTSGVVKVDTKAAGFVVLNVPVNSEVTVSGVKHSTGELSLAATGLRY